MNDSSTQQHATTQEPSGWRAALLLYSKGIAMGLGDSVPGISGGTIAVLTNIYDRLIFSLRAFDLDALRLLFSGQIKRAWTHINGNFLLLLAVGVLTGLLLSANTVLYLLDSHFEVLMAFFIGLVLACSYLLRRQFSVRDPVQALLLVAGIIVTAAIGFLESREGSITGLGIFLAGAVAICAMILPGLSGAFILLLLGMYEYMLEALLGLQWGSIVLFVAGCVTGLLAFSRLLAWLLQRFHARSYAFITGLLLGSLNALWPWQATSPQAVDALDPALSTYPVWPLNYYEVTGQEPVLPGVLAMAVVGAVLVLGIHRAAHGGANP
ncbi:MAG: DUF368 domain-containing protein [Pseudohongiellaceae bacterium]